MSSISHPPPPSQHDTVGEVILGVDTHKQVHVAAVVSLHGALLGSQSFPTTAEGYQAMLQWATTLGRVARAGVEGTHSYGSALSRHLLAHLMVTVKANQPKLHTQLKALPWTQVPIGAQTRETGHGRKETRTVKALTVKTPGGLGFAHAQQAIRITRTRTIKGKTSRETAYLTISLPAGQAQPADLGTWARSEWHIENRLHYVRDVTLREDAHQARTHNGPAVFATLRNTAIGYHHTNGATNIAEATRQASHRSHELIDAVTTGKPTVTRSNSTTQ